MSKKPFENPLTPNKLLREMYLAMLEVRRLPKTKAGIGRGLEGMLVAPAIGLRGHGEDLVSDPGAGAGLDVALGAKRGRDPRRLLPMRQPADHLLCSLGAAMAVRAAGRNGVVLIYAHAAELDTGGWMHVFQTSVLGQLPILFAILPRDEAITHVCGMAQKAKLPAIPVDAMDPIALYRVAQESILRARAGGGPALLAGLESPGKTVRSAADPLMTLAEQLLRKKACTPGWLARAAQRRSVPAGSKGR